MSCIAYATVQIVVLILVAIFVLATPSKVSFIAGMTNTERPHLVFFGVEFRFIHWANDANQFWLSNAGCPAIGENRLVRTAHSKMLMNTIVSICSVGL